MKADLDEVTQWLTDYFGEQAPMELAMAAATFVVVFVVLRIIRHVLLRRLVTLTKRTKTIYDDIICSFLHDLHWLFYALVALYIALQGLTLPEQVSIILNLIFLIAVVYHAVTLSADLIILIVDRQLGKDGESGLPGVFKVIVRLALWLIGILLILSNLGINVVSLIAGLGIGGLAISLALQSTFEDLFSSISLALDKPFAEGDFIIVGEYMGTVKHIGLKTTRLEALQGEEIVIANKELTTSLVQNFKKMEKRRVVFEIGVTYDTPATKLQMIDDILERAVGAHSNTKFDRCHFHKFGDSSLLYEVVYYIETADYYVYMDTQEAINLEIVETFEQEGIEMAFPTRTIYMKKEA